jgi:histidyl-tRNA synthetase
MESLGITLPTPEEPDLFLVFIGTEAKAKALSLAADLRKAGVVARMDPAGRSVKNQFKYADRLKARYTVVIGEEEIAAGEATVKDMISGEQKKTSFAGLSALVETPRDRS